MNEEQQLELELRQIDEQRQRKAVKLVSQAARTDASKKQSGITPPVKFDFYSVYIPARMPPFDYAGLRTQVLQAYNHYTLIGLLAEFKYLHQQQILSDYYEMEALDKLIAAATGFVSERAALEKILHAVAYLHSEQLAKLAKASNTSQKEQALKYMLLNNRAEQVRVYLEYARAHNMDCKDQIRIKRDYIDYMTRQRNSIYRQGGSTRMWELYEQLRYLLEVREELVYQLQELGK